MVRRLVVVGSLALALALAGVGFGARDPETARAEGCRAFAQFIVPIAQMEGPFGDEFDWLPGFGSPGFALQSARAHHCGQ